MDILLSGNCKFIVFFFFCIQGIIKRDEIVFTKVRAKNIPIVMVTSGGYTMETAKIIADSILNLKEKKLISMESDNSIKHTFPPKGNEESGMLSDHLIIALQFRKCLIFR